MSTNVTKGNGTEKIKKEIEISKEEILIQVLVSFESEDKDNHLISYGIVKPTPRVKNDGIWIIVLVCSFIGIVIIIAVIIFVIQKGKKKEPLRLSKDIINDSALVN